MPDQSQGCLFSSALVSRISNICKVSMDGSFVLVPMSMLWIGPSIKDIYKTVEDSDRSFLNRGTNIGSRQSNHPLFRYLVVCDKHEKVSFQALSKLRVSGARNKFKGYDLVLPEEKNNKVAEQCQFLLKKPLVTVREMNQVIGWLSSTANAALTAPLQYRTMHSQQIMEFSMKKGYN